MDTETIKHIVKGDKEAFRRLYEIYIDKALYTAIAIIKNKELAKDAVQETFIRVYHNLSSFDTSKPFEPWFYRILINECNRSLKKESKILTINHSYMDNDIKLSKEPRDDYSEVYEAIQSLKNIYRVPVILKYLKGFSEKEIADIMNININTIKSRLYKGREKLREKLDTINNGREYHG